MNRKIWSSEEKTGIVLELLRGKDSAAAICARHGVSAVQALRWREQFVFGGKAVLRDKRSKNGKDPMIEENRRLKELLGEQSLIIDTQKKFAGLLGAK